MVKYVALLILLLPSQLLAQSSPPLPDGAIEIQIEKLLESMDLTPGAIDEANFSVSDIDRLQIVTEATVRVTVGGSCGSGTVVGFASDGRAVVLTNAHVAGTKRGRVSNLQRWNVDGSYERGTGKIIASGYARGLSVDYALLKCDPEFAQGITPIPIVDRQPDGNHATNYGCPRCEWPSMQTVKIDDGEGQILKWRPEAIGGRSGSAIVDYSGPNGTPVVVALLTWGGGGQGLGQSSPFLLRAFTGVLPRSLEPLPPMVTEVSCQIDPDQSLIDAITLLEGPPDVEPIAPTEVDPEPAMPIVPIAPTPKQPGSSGKAKVIADLIRGVVKDEVTGSIWMAALPAVVITIVVMLAPFCLRCSQWLLKAYRIIKDAGAKVNQTK